MKKFGFFILFLIIPSLTYARFDGVTWTGANLNSLQSSYVWNFGDINDISSRFNVLWDTGGWALPYDTEADLLNLLATNTINVRFLGSDYLVKTFTGYQLCQTLNIEIIYLNRHHTFSSSELRSRIAHSSV
jgi:hypothetical protein